MSFSPPRIPKDSPSYLIWSIFSKEREERAKKHKKGQKAGQRTKSADRSPMSNLHNKVRMLFQVLGKGTFYSEGAGDLCNLQINEPNIAPELLFPVNDMNGSDKMLIFSFFCVYRINLFKSSTNRY